MLSDVLEERERHRVRAIGCGAGLNGFWNVAFAFNTPELLRL